MARGMMVLLQAVVDHLEARDICVAPTIAGHGKGVDKTLTMLNAHNRSSITL